MAEIQVRALQRVMVGGQWHLPGDPAFKVENNKATQEFLQSRALEAVGEPEKTTTPAATKKPVPTTSRPRLYNRRDMKATES